VRTIFLLGILSTLIVIAIKKPDQTAWQAALELVHQTHAAYSKNQQMAFDPLLERTVSPRENKDSKYGLEEPLQAKSQLSPPPYDDPVHKRDRTDEPVSLSGKIRKKEIEIRVAEKLSEKNSPKEASSFNSLGLPKLKEVDIKERPVAMLNKKSEVEVNAPKELGKLNYRKISNRYEKLSDMLRKIQ